MNTSSNENAITTDKDAMLLNDILTPEKGGEMEDSIVEPDQNQEAAPTIESNFENSASNDENIPVEIGSTWTAPNHDNAFDETEALVAACCEEEKEDSVNARKNSKAIIRKLNDLQTTLNRLEKEFQGKLRYDQHKEQIIDTLHAELQDHRNDFLKKIRVPIIMDIIHMMDDIKKIIRHYRDPITPEVSAKKLLGMFDSFYDDLEEILYRQMVEPFRDLDAEFNPSRQKATRTVVTDEKSKNKTVSRSLQDGFDWEGKILRPELVEVNVYKKNIPSNE